MTSGKETSHGREGATAAGTGSGRNKVQGKRLFRCMVGWHRWTVIPRSILDTAQSAGLRRPDWYVGRQTRAYCEHCGTPRYPRETP